MKGENLEVYYDEKKIATVSLNQKGQRKFFPQFRKEWDTPRHFLGDKFTIFEMLQILHKWFRDSLREETILPILDYTKLEDDVLTASDRIDTDSQHNAVEGESW